MVSVLIGSILTMFINRVKSQIRQLQAFTDSLRKRQRNLDPNSDYADDESTTVLKRDQFNIIKMMLLMTEGRKMFALNSQSKLNSGNKVQFLKL